MIRFKRKYYSIQGGGYKGERRGPDKASLVGRSAGYGVIGAGIGGLSHRSSGLGGVKGTAIGLAAGAAIGAFSAWLHDLVDKSVFNARRSTRANSYTLIDNLEAIYKQNFPIGEETTVSHTQVDKESGVSRTVTRKTDTRNTTGIQAKGVMYTVNDSPDKHVVSAYYSANVLILYINRPKNHELSFLNKILDEYCYRYKNADYTANQIRDGVYEVEVAVVEGTEYQLCEQLVNSGFCLNIVTENKF